MTLSHRIRYMALATLVGMLASSVAPALTVEELLAEMPAENSDHAARLFAHALTWDDAQLTALCDRVGPWEAGHDAEAALALHGLAQYVMRPDNSAHRGAVARLYETALARADHPDVQRFFMMLLQVCGDADTVAALAPYLCDHDVFDDAIQTLQSIGGAAATALLENADCGEMPDGFDTAVETGLMRMGDATAAAADAIGLDPLLFQAATMPPASDAASRVAALAREALRDNDHEPHVHALALRALTNAKGAAALPDLIDAAKSSERILWGAALQLAATLPGESVSSAWIQWLPDLPEAVRPQVVYMLGQRDDAASHEAVVAALTDESQALRIAAAETIGRIGGDPALAALERAMYDAEDTAEIDAVKQALLQYPAAAIAPIAARRALRGDPAQRIAYLEILAAQHADHKLDTVRTCLTDEELRVRRAAVNALADIGTAADMTLLFARLLEAPSGAEANTVRTALVTVADRHEARDVALAQLHALFGDADADGQARLLQVLGTLGDADALAAARGIVEKALFEAPTDEALAERALETLGTWPRTDAAHVLLDLLERVDDPEQRMTVLQRFMTAVSRTVSEDKDQAALLEKAVPLCRTEDEKAALEEALAPLRDAEE